MFCILKFFNYLFTPTQTHNHTHKTLQVYLHYVYSHYVFNPHAVLYTD